MFPGRLDKKYPEDQSWAIQEAMGHKCLETIMGYLHAESSSVASPTRLSEGERNGARCWFRTSDPYRVKVMLYH